MSALGPALFFVASAIAIAGALVTVLSKNAIRAAMGLLTTIVGIAGLYLTLSAQLLAAIQLIVYAGAVVVLFVFVIMMLGPSGGPIADKRTFKSRLVGGGLFAAAALAALVLALRAMSALTQPASGKLPAGFPHTFDPPRPELGTVDGVGRVLFGEGMVAFELSGLLLLVAIVAVMAVARTRLPSPDRTPPAANAGPAGLDTEVSSDSDLAQSDPGGGKQAAREAT